VCGFFLAGQKSGILQTLDPDRQGAELRQIRIGNGGVLGGIEWGFATDGETAYTAVSDLDWNHPEAGGELTAVRIATGEKVWHVTPPKPSWLRQADFRCTRGRAREAGKGLKSPRQPPDCHL
jgi:hypothetical protein